MPAKLTLSVFLIILGGATASAQSRPQSGIQYDDVWYLLEVERKPAVALQQFEELAARAETTKIVRAKCYLGIAKCNELLGNKDAAIAKWREAREKFGEFPFVAQEVTARLSNTTNARFITGIQRLATGQHLDLDTGGVFSEPRALTGAVAEIQFNNLESLNFTTDLADAPDAASTVPWLSDAAWKRTTTDLDHTSWIQVLAAAPGPVIRYITKISGSGELLPTPGNLCCVGLDHNIQVWFDADSRYQQYRVERRASPESPWTVAGLVEQPPFVDLNIPDGVRVGYRVTGITAAGDEGIPGSTQGTVKSAGVVRGTVIFDAENRQVDLVTGKFVTNGGDLRLTGTFGGAQSASFSDYTNSAAVYCNESVQSVRSRFALDSDAFPESTYYASEGESMLIPMRGGGVAMCRWRVPDRKDPGRIRVDYEYLLDADAFPASPELTITGAEGNVNIHVVAAPGTAVENIYMKDVLKNSPPIAIPVNDGMAILNNPAESILELRATAADRLRRATRETIIIVNRLPDRPVSGTISLKIGEGFSFAHRAKASLDEADLICVSTAGGNQSIHFRGTELINCEQLFQGRKPGDSVKQIYDSIVGLEPGELISSSKVHSDSRSPASDVIIVRPRLGGFVKIMIQTRGQAPDWRDSEIVMNYVYNPREPRFVDALPDEFATVSGLILKDTDLKDILKWATRDQWIGGQVRMKSGQMMRFEKFTFDAAGDMAIEATGTRGVDAMIQSRNGILQISKALAPDVIKNMTGLELFHRVKSLDGHWVLPIARVHVPAENRPEDLLLIQTKDAGFVKVVIINGSERQGEEPAGYLVRFVKSGTPVFGGKSTGRGATFSNNLNSTGESSIATGKSEFGTVQLHKVRK